jgi:AGCS family alanine or glycine:cation symporter
MHFILFYFLYYLQKYYLLLILLKDYTSQLKKGIKEPEFKIDNYPELKKKVDSDIW